MTQRVTTFSKAYLTPSFLTLLRNIKQTMATRWCQLGSLFCSFFSNPANNTTWHTKWLWLSALKAYHRSSSWRLACLWCFVQPIVNAACNAHLYSSCILRTEVKTPCKSNVKVLWWTGRQERGYSVTECCWPCCWRVCWRWSWKRCPSPTCS